MKNKIQQEQTAYRGGIDPRRTLVLRGKQREQRPKRKISVSSVTSLFKLRCRVVSLLAQMFQGLAHRCAGNLDHASERMIHFQDDKNRTRNRQRADEQHGDDGCIARRKKAEAQVQHGKPKEQDDEECKRKRALCRSINSQRACSISLLICSACEIN